MTAPDQNAYQNWWKNTVGAAVPWLAGGVNGQAEGKAWPAVLDYLVSQLVQARYQCFPDYCAADALPAVGNDRQFIQGMSETAASFKTRCRTAPDTWPRAGSAGGVLEQLWYYGLTGAYWVQQNGLYYTFGSNTLTPGADPTALLQSGSTSPLGSVLTSTVNNARTIPAGTPWFYFDGNTDLCNRFAIILPTWSFSALALASFANSDSAVVTWPFAFGSSTYNVIYGSPAAPVVLNVDGTTQTTSGVTLRASAPWTGSVWVVAYTTGVNPLNMFSATNTGAVQRLISTFRPNSLCTGVYAIRSGRMWDWPANTTWDGYGGNWDSGPSVITQILGAF